MAADGTKVIRGITKVEIGPWVTAKGAATLVDMGYLGAAGCTVQPKVTYHEVDTSQHLAPIHAWPSKREVEIKIPMSEADANKLLMAFNIAVDVTHQTGTTPNFTNLIDADAAEAYHQIKITMKGVGTTAVRTQTYWRCVPTACDAIPFKKDGEQVYNMTFKPTFEETGAATADNLFKQADA